MSNYIFCWSNLTLIGLHTVNPLASLLPLCLGIALLTVYSEGVEWLACLRIRFRVWWPLLSRCGSMFSNPVLLFSLYTHTPTPMQERSCCAVRCARRRSTQSVWRWRCQRGRGPAGSADQEGNPTTNRSFGSNWETTGELMHTQKLLERCWLMV